MCVWPWSMNSPPRSPIWPSANAPRSVQQRPPIRVVRLVDLGGVARVPQRVGRVEPGQARADDDDLRRRGTARGRGEAAERGDAERGDPGLLDETRARRAPLAGGDRRDRVLNGACEWCTCHCPSPSPD